ncbi:hypothetical protein [Actinopolyspora halophila]|uniref:hypothetical protein n=1 Tax=Actinopolyspora halophila TaxID=1850 RepID=UPI000378F035|nr:hypothetical protein [Actinopolyspora halophila]
MRDVETVRELIGHADPAQSLLETTSGRPPAADLIARAEMHDRTGKDESSVRGSLVRGRWLNRYVVTATAAVLSAVLLGGIPFLRGTIAVSEQSPPEVGPVRAATALDVDVSGRRASRELITRANDLETAPYETADGELGYIRTHEWANALCSSELEHCVNYALKRETWLTGPAAGSARTVPELPEFGSAADRDFWKRQSGWGGTRKTDGSRITPDELHLAQCVPEHPGKVAECLNVRNNDSRDVFRSVVSLFEHELLPRDVRAEVLRVLARTPGVHFRGMSEVRGHPVFAAGLTTDRVGDDVSEVLLFDRTSGVLRSFEKVNLSRDELTGYVVFEKYGRTNTRG